MELGENNEVNDNIDFEIPPNQENKKQSSEMILNLHESMKPKSSKKRIKSNKKKKKISQQINIEVTDTKNVKTTNTIETEEIKEKLPNEIRKIDLIYSPRTTFSKKKIEENKLFNELSMGFDPITIRILKSTFKERLGALNKLDFIGICKNHLLSWYPNLENRKNVLIKFLNRLFKEIDMNNSGKITWEEFTNYIIHNSNNEQDNTIAYSLRHYSISKKSIDDSDFTDIVTVSFYIEKYNLIGVVQDGKSIINFYDAKTMNKLKFEIDVKDTQREINELEIKELNNRAKDLVKKEEEEKILKKQKHENKMRGSLSKDSLNNLSPNRKRTINYNEYDINNNNKNQNETSDRLKKELERLTNDGLNSIQNSINKKLTVLTTEFIPEYDLLLVSSSNNKISSWKFIEGSFKNVNQISNNIIDRHNFSCAILSTITPQYTMTWDPMQKHLYTGQMDGKILKWNLTKSKNLENETLDFTIAKVQHELELKGNFVRNSKKTKTIISMQTQVSQTVKIENDDTKNLRGEKLLDKMKKDNKKRDSVSCICILGKLQLLAAGYYNGHVILWDTMLKDYRKYYYDQDTCIYQINYNESKNLIFTCGFDHDIFIYDPYIDGNAVYKLVGHNISVNSIAFNPIEEELISIDIVGNIKIWDINNFYNFQTININESYSDRRVQQDINNSKKKTISSNLKMIFLSKPKKIFTYGERNLILEADISHNPDLADDQLILGCYYNFNLYEFVLICLKKVKIWNAFNGKVIKIYNNIMGNNEITSYTTDKILKKLYLGDNLGKIKSFNINKGTVLKEFHSHLGEIEEMIHSEKYHYLITLSNDGIVKIHTDKMLFETEVIKEIDLFQSTISTICISDDFSRLIIGLNTGNVKFFDVEHLRFDPDDIDNERDIIFKHDSIITMISLSKIPIVCIGHSSGKIRFSILPPNPNKFIWFGLFTNTIIKDENTINSCILTMDLNNEKKYLFTGDIGGYIHCYDLSIIYDIISSTDNEINNETINKFKSININLKYQIQASKERIKNIFFPNLIPNILLSTSNDRKCKIFLAENGEYIDSLKQIASKYKDVPIGIEYFLADPFESKRDKNKEVSTGIIYRKDLDKHKSLITNALIQHLREENPKINAYTRAITAANATEKLFLITKNCNMPSDKSNNWNLNINIEIIERNEQNKFENIYHKVILNETNNKDIKVIQSQPIYSDDYVPNFIDDLSEDKLKDFSVMLSQKLRHVKLAMSKVQSEKNAIEKFKKDDLRKKTINLQQSIEMLNEGEKKNKKIKVMKVDKNDLKRKEMYGLNKRKIRSINERLDFYKEDFDKGINELQYSIEKNIVKKYLNPIRSSNKLILPKIQSRNNLQLTEPGVHSYN